MRLHLTLLLTLLSACAPKTVVVEHTAAPAAAPASSPQNLFVLAWFDADFFEAPDGTPVGSAYDFGEEAREAHLGEHYPMRVLEDRGDWVRVVPPHEWLRADTTSLHCISNNLFAIDAFAVELWVHQDDLVPVLQQRFTHRTDEHSHVDLLPGTPIIAGHPWADGYHLPVTAPPQHIGLRYQPAASLIPEAEGYTYSDVSDVTLTMGTTTVPWRQPVANYATERIMRIDDAGQHAMFTGSCGHFGLSFEGTVGDDSMSNVLLGMMGGTAPRVQAIEIPTGTPLRWRDGTHAGSVIKTFRREGVPPDGPTMCMSVPMGVKLQTTTYLDTAATLCVDRADVREIEMDFHPLRTEEQVEWLN